MLLIPRSLALLLGVSLAAASEGNSEPSSSSGSALNPPGLQPLVSRANVLLQSGHYADAARSYADAIELSPLDYTLYYKRGTAYYSLSRHAQSLADFEKVMELSSVSGGGGLDKALLMQARIHAKLGAWPDARAALKAYSSRPSGSKDKGETNSLLASLTAAEASASRAAQSRRAGLNQACVDATTDALRVASHSPDLRALRAECALSAGDAPAAIGDFVRLTHLVQTPSEGMLTRLAALSYFLLPPSTQALSTLKQCLHSDPDSKLCKALHKTIKALDKVFTKLDAAREKGDWRTVTTLILGSTKVEGKELGSGLLKQYADALTSAFPAQNSPSSTVNNMLPPSLTPPQSNSPQYKHLVHQLCVAHAKLSTPSKGTRWCDELLFAYRSSQAGETEVTRLQLTAEEEKDAYLGIGEAKMSAEEWDDAVRAFEKAFELSGRSDHDVRHLLPVASLKIPTYWVHRWHLNYKKRNVFSSNHGRRIITKYWESPEMRMKGRSRKPSKSRCFSTFMLFVDICPSQSQSG